MYRIDGGILLAPRSPGRAGEQTHHGKHRPQQPGIRTGPHAGSPPSERAFVRPSGSNERSFFHPQELLRARHTRKWLITMEVFPLELNGFVFLEPHVFSW